MLIVDAGLAPPARVPAPAGHAWLVILFDDGCCEYVAVPEGQVDDSVTLSITEPASRWRTA